MKSKRLTDLSKSALLILVVLFLSTLFAGSALAIDICGNGICCTWCTPAENANNCHADCYCPSSAETDEGDMLVSWPNLSPELMVADAQPEPQDESVAPGTPPLEDSADE